MNRRVPDGFCLPVTVMDETQMRAGDVTLGVVCPTAAGGPPTAAFQLDPDGYSFLFANGLSESERTELLESGLDLDAEVVVLPNEIEKELLEQVMPETVILFIGRRAQDKPNIVYQGSTWVLCAWRKSFDLQSLSMRRG
jgi:hypothetical protein